MKAGGRLTALRLDDMVGDYVRDVRGVRIVEGMRRNAVLECNSYMETFGADVVG